MGRFPARGLRKPPGRALPTLRDLNIHGKRALGMTFDGRTLPPAHFLRCALARRTRLTEPTRQRYVGPVQRHRASVRYFQSLYYANNRRSCRRSPPRAPAYFNDAGCQRADELTVVRTKISAVP